MAQKYPFHRHFDRSRLISVYLPIICWVCLLCIDQIETYASDSPTAAALISNSRNAVRNRLHASKRHAIHQLRRHIEAVLNLDDDDDDASDLMDALNVRNPNPIYVFVVPGAGAHSNRTIAYRRSDFIDTTFPNTTILQHFHKMLRDSSFKPYIDAIDDQQMHKQLHVNNRRFLANYKEFLSDHSDELGSLDAIEENVRTEKNFFKFMDEVNGHGRADSDRLPKHLTADTSDYRSLIQGLHSTDSVGDFALAGDNKAEQRARRLTEPDAVEVTWDDLGLAGWAGSIRMKHTRPQENRHLMPIDEPHDISHSKIFPAHFVPILANYDPLALLTSTTSTTTASPPFGNLFQPNYPFRPQSVHQSTFIAHRPSDALLQRPPAASFPKPAAAANFQFAPQSHRPAVHRRPHKPSPDTWDIYALNITDELRVLLESERIHLKNVSIQLRQPKFAVTNSRWLHQDDDIFVARSNNPFGHSTKWKLSNASQEENAIAGPADDGRQKRDVLDLYSMVKCSTGCDPLIFKGYGCYCGFLGKGKALDGIDQCCKMHDYCYYLTNCPKFLEYFVPYLWKCYRGKPICAINHGEWGGPGSCAATLCECDRALSNCLRRYLCPRKRAICTSSPLRLLQNLFMII